MGLLLSYKKNKGRQPGESPAFTSLFVRNAVTAHILPSQNDFHRPAHISRFIDQFLTEMEKKR